MKPVYIVAPADSVSGGPEVLHQLADALNQTQKCARMLYFPFESRHKVPPPYARYNTEVAELNEVDSDSIIVLPETCARFITKFRFAEIYFWWLSVDYFFTAAEKTRLARIIGGANVGRLNLSKARRRVSKHLYQSEYARQFLEKRSLTPVAHLGDYLAREYLERVECERNLCREDLIVYNPAKGSEQTARILRAIPWNDFPSARAVPITGMSRAEICGLLERAKVYIDFGYHPGRDRIPREAVALGTALIVNRQGSAGNAVDIPIPEAMKINDALSNFADTAVERIVSALTNFEATASQFEPYRRAIADEPRAFLADVRSVFEAGK